MLISQFMSRFCRVFTEIRTEAVMQALALDKKPSMAPMPSKRTSTVYNDPNRHREHAAGDYF